MNKSTKCKAVLEQYNILYEQYKKNISSTKDRKIFKTFKVYDNKSYQYYKKLSNEIFSTIQVLTDIMDL